MGAVTQNKKESNIAPTLAGETCLRLNFFPLLPQLVSPDFSLFNNIRGSSSNKPLNFNDFFLFILHVVFGNLVNTICD